MNGLDSRLFPERYITTLFRSLRFLGSAFVPMPPEHKAYSEGRYRNQRDNQS